MITIAAGRRDHLRRQCDGLRAGAAQPDVRVVVAMRPDEDLPAYREIGGDTTALVELADDDGDPLAQAGNAGAARTLERGSDRQLPLARARNAGAAHALERGAELLVFLDVDCIPSTTLLERYAGAAAATSARDESALLCGPVAYLPPAPPGGYDLATLPALARPHPARPLPRDDELRRDGDHRLFWSLSFAVTARDWALIGGFHQGYAGYGAEDTDFGQLARAAGVGLCWVGGATAYHQHHATSDPPVQHLDDILANAARFHRRWGWWPMEGWLDAFARLGLARHDPRQDRWVRVDDVAPRPRRFDL